jgi:DNA-binding MarR family transcriptional regulator
MIEEYLAIIPLIERLHRHFLNTVKSELECSDIRDTNNVQAIIMFNLGDAEMTVGELTLRSCYLGSNVSYNLKKMVENDYIEQAQSLHDRRSVHVKLTPKGRALRDRLAEMHRRHAESLQRVIATPDLEHTAAMLDLLERFWIRVGDGRVLSCSTGSITSSASSQPRN